MLLLQGFPPRIFCVVVLLSFWIPQSWGQSTGLGKTSEDIEYKYTSVGNIGLTVTNFGTIGTRNNYWPRQPSGEYPRGSRIEHIFQGSLWVGAQIRTRDPADPRNDQFLVSTGAHDRSSSSRGGGEGYEFNTQIGDTITELSSLTNDRPLTSQFSAEAISHQDFICDYTDRFTRVPTTGDSVVGHLPLGIRIHQESYAWNFPFADFFVILRYNIVNASADTLDSVHVGLWNNAVVRNTNFVRPRTPGYFENTGHGFDKAERMAYSFDFNGAPGGPPADSYVGVRLLGCTPFPRGVDSLADLANFTYYNAWQFRASSGDEAYLSPTSDFDERRFLSRYSRMTQSMPQDKIDPLRISPKNVTYLLSTGPFPRMNPGDTLEVVFAVVCAKKFGSEPASLDKREHRKTLYSNAGWAQQAYNGETIDGVVTRYSLPKPPLKPKSRAQVENQSVVMYWDKSSAEESVDPIFGIKDFAGYRIYRSNAGDDFRNPEDYILNMSLVGDFDRDDDTVGYNTGFGQIRLQEAKVFPCDTTFTTEGLRVNCDTIHYWYRFPPAGAGVEHLNGWQYVYGVSAYDVGDPSNNVPSLESAKSLHRVVPGTPARRSSPEGVGVYPNPYYVNAFWDGVNRERLRKIYFNNLPSRCVITIYTLAGDVVTELQHDASTYAGQGIEWFRQYGDRSTSVQFAGGEHAWDLITRYDQAVATGLYLFTVKDLESGNVQRGKFLIVK